MLFWLLLIFGAYTDYSKRKIPNSIIFCIYAISFFSRASVIERVAGFLIPALPLFFIALKYECIKGGDVKYISAVGAYLGLYNLSLTFIFATITAIIFGFIKSEKSVPLGFVFCIGYMIFNVLSF